MTRSTPNHRPAPYRRARPKPATGRDNTRPTRQPRTSRRTPPHAGRPGKLAAWTRRPTPILVIVGRDPRTRGWAVARLLAWSARTKQTVALANEPEAQAAQLLIAIAPAHAEPDADRLLRLALMRAALGRRTAVVTSDRVAALRWEQAHADSGVALIELSAPGAPT